MSNLNLLQLITSLQKWQLDNVTLVAQTVKRLPTMWETQVRSLGQEDPLAKEMATHSSILAWKIPWMEKPGRLQSMGSQRVGQGWATSLSPYILSIICVMCENHLAQSWLKKVKKVKLLSRVWLFKTLCHGL